MEIKRDGYLNQLIAYAWDGQVKVITGIRRCGKSYLLRTLYRNHLLQSGVREKYIIEIALDLAADIRYRNPLELAAYVRSIAEGRDGQFCRACRDIARLADVLGHSSIETTRIYLISSGIEHARTLESLRPIL